MRLPGELRVRFGRLRRLASASARRGVAVAVAGATLQARAPMAFAGAGAAAPTAAAVSMATQITWGLGYIQGRYNNPCGAKSFWLSHN